jgi:hypothetical protein
MTMNPSLRKFALTIHLTSSVGWIGAVVAYLVIVIAAMTRQDTEMLRAAWITLELIGWYVIIPLALISLLTGLVMSLGTSWGLFRHYWVLFSLVLTTIATVILLQHMQGVRADIHIMDASGLQGELLHGGIGLLVLLVLQILNIYKPRGLTPYGWRKQQEQRRAAQA